MSKHGPILAVIGDAHRALIAGVRAASSDSIVEADWAHALQAFDRTPPAAVIASLPAEGSPAFETLAMRLATAEPNVPLIVLNVADPLPANAIPFSSTGNNADRLVARLRAALRVRAVHATMLRRQGDQPSASRLFRIQTRCKTPPSF